MARAACPRLGVLMLVWGFTAAFGALYPYFVLFDNYSYPGLWLILLWPSAVYFLFSYFYFFDGNLGIRLIDKSRVTGEVPWLTFLPLFPYLLLMHAWWLLRHTLWVNCKEDPYNLVAPGLYCGRFPMKYPGEFPVEATAVVDLTAEFSARKDVIKGRKYVCVPALDCEMPADEDIVRTAKRMAAHEGSIYVHCANGHGRSATYCAVVMMYRGQARGWRHAFTVMKAKRPWINIQRPQELAMDRIEGILRQHGALPQHQQPPHHLCAGAGAGAGTGAGPGAGGAGTAAAPVVELEMQLLDGHGAGASASTAEATTAARTGTGTSPAT